MADTKKGELRREKPITERSNAKSENIDTASSLDLVDVLHSCEEEIFTGWDSLYQNIFDQDVVKTLSDVSLLAASIIKDPGGGAVIMSGCGTSGRLAFFIATKMNALLKSLGIPPCFDYIIAGGYRALTHSVEAFEDSPQAGRDDLRKAAEGKKKVLFIGITCGLSAPYVAGQLSHCMSSLDRYTPVLLGFNPTHLARNQPIQGWDKTFLTVTKELEELAKTGQGFILNPVVGPEPISGSSRMKGGGATKILLETCFLTALSSTATSHLHGNQSSASDVSRGSSWDGQAAVRLARTLLEAYQETWERCYQAMKESVAKLTELAGKSLKSPSHVYYLGWDLLAILGLIDASECPPTFGSDFDDIRGFLDGGLASVCSANIKEETHEDDTSLTFFRRSIIPALTALDTVILLLPELDPSKKQSAVAILKELQNIPQLQVGIISTDKDGDIQQLLPENCVSICIEPPQQGLMTGLKEAGLGEALEGAVTQCMTEFVVKSALNAISTGSHVMKGKVFKNFMVDLKLSNSKLLERGIGIVERFAECSGDQARDAVMRAIYRSDEVESNKPVSEVIEKAANVDKVVPTAIILAVKKCIVKEALEAQDVLPVIRTCLLDLLHK